MKTTPLHQIHKSFGAKMVEFGGWEMPVEYSGLKQEHLAVRRQAGLFDVSHMGEIELRGPRALDLVQQLTPNDAARLVPGRSQYSALLTPQGTFVDDIMIYRIAPDHFLFCVNASNSEKDFQWILSHRISGVEIVNSSDTWGLLALQGPAVRSLLPSSLKKNHFQKTEVEGVEVILSTTGYTGEDGYELFCRSDQAPNLWNHLLKKGSVTPCGLGARDTLRLEACYPLYGHEIDNQTTPFEANLGWIVKPEKGDFLGKQALREPPKKTLVGIEMREPGIARQGHKIFSTEETSSEGALRGRLDPALPVEGATLAPTTEIGWVTSGTFSPSFEKPIALGYVTLPLTNQTLLGKKIQVEIRGKRKLAEIVPLPFYKKV